MRILTYVPEPLLSSILTRILSFLTQPYFADGAFRAEGAFCADGPFCEPEGPCARDAPRSGIGGHPCADGDS